MELVCSREKARVNSICYHYLYKWRTFFGAVRKLCNNPRILKLNLGRKGEPKEFKPPRDTIESLKTTLKFFWNFSENSQVGNSLMFIKGSRNSKQIISKFISGILIDRRRIFLYIFVESGKFSGDLFHRLSENSIISFGKVSFSFRTREFLKIHRIHHGYKYIASYLSFPAEFLSFRRSLSSPWQLLGPMEIFENPLTVMMIINKLQQIKFWKLFCF